MSKRISQLIDPLLIVLFKVVPLLYFFVIVKRVKNNRMVLDTQLKSHLYVALKNITSPTIVRTNVASSEAVSLIQDVRKCKHRVLLVDVQ